MDGKITQSKYFPDEHPALKNRLDQFLAQTRQRLAREAENLDIAALVLAGGYGRGEGGVFTADENGGNERLYNDLEFYLFTRARPSLKLRQWAGEIEYAATEELGIDVEIRLFPIKWFTAASPSMFAYDLVCAHEIIYGPADILRHGAPAGLRDPSRIPWHEATRLLFNRGSGLLFSAGMLEGVDPGFDTGFIQRNHAKLKLALADAVLAVNGLYHWSCLERERRLADALPQTPRHWDEIRKLHAEGVQFKLHPRHQNLPIDELKRRQQDLVKIWESVFLWVESLRLETPLENLQSYAKFSGRILHESPEFQPLKNLLCRVRDYIRYRKTLPRPFDYPRGVLQRALAAFLSGRDGKLDLAAGAKILGIPESEAFGTYRRWWSRYN